MSARCEHRGPARRQAAIGNGPLVAGMVHDLITAFLVAFAA